jgi:hypothetical protein
VPTHRGRAISLAVITLLPLSLAGCAAAGATIGPSASPAATQSTAPSTQGATPEPSLGAGTWQALELPPELRDATIEDVVAVDTGFIAVGCIGTLATCEAPAIWTSGDGLAWSPPIELPVRPDEIPRPANSAAVLAGTVVVGGTVGTGDRTNAALWIAVDGGAFERIPDLPSFTDASVRNLRRVDGGLVALGSQAYMDYFGFRPWYSSDGRSWAPAAAESSDVATPTGMIVADDGIVAWGPTCSVCPAETAFWRSADGETWTEARHEIEGDFAFVTALGATEAGLLAFGTIGVDPPAPAAWFSAKGSAGWDPTEPPPQPDRTSIRSHLAVGGGAVLAGTTLVGDQPTGLVWFSRPGEADWRLTATLADFTVIGLRQDPARPERILLVGQSGLEKPTLAIWSGSVDWIP